MTYRPCTTGLHVCGVFEEGHGGFFTERNFALGSREAATRLFKAGQVEFGSGDDGDFIIDLMIDGDLMDTFYIRRQMLDRLAALAQTEASDV